MKKRIIFLSVISLFALIASLSFLVIYKDVKATCLKAQSQYQQDCVNSLIKYIQSDGNTFRARNSAIWALGQLANKEALPFLRQLDKSLPEQQKCSYDNYLCKYEVQKAIKWCEQGNVTNWMYRNRASWRDEIKK